MAFRCSSIMNGPSRFLRRLLLGVCVVLGWLTHLPAQGLYVKAIDREGQPVSQVAFELYSLDTNALVTFGLTDANGETFLKADSGTYLLESRHLSFESDILEVEIKPDGVDTVVRQMIPKSVELKDVIVRQKMAAGRLKGDTLSYNLKAFTNGSEEKLKDVINKLPGMEVTESGKIKANGKEVDHLLINGKEFFGDNQKAATDNLDADMLEGIDLLSHYENFDAIKDIEGSDKTAVNIRLKQEYKGKLVGSVDAFGGYRKAYQLHSNLFSFSPKFNFTGIFDVNNINAQTIGLLDYLSLTKSVKRDIRTEHRVGLLGEEVDLPDFLISDDHAKKKNVAFGAINFALYPRERLTISGFSTLNYLNIKENRLSYKYFDPSLPSLSYREEVGSNGGFLFNQTYLNCEYLPGKNTLLDYSFRWNPSRNNEKRESTSTLLDSVSNSSVVERKRSREQVLGHQISIIKRIRRLNLLGLSAYHEMSRTDKRYFVNSTDTLFDAPLHRINQSDQLLSNDYGAIIKWTKKMPNNLILKFAAGYDAKSDHFFLGSDYIEDSLSVRYLLLNPYSFLSLARRKGLFQYSLNLRVDKYKFFYQTRTSNGMVFTPSARLKLSFSQLNELSIYFDRTISHPSLLKLNPDRYVSDYKNFSVGQQSLFDVLSVANMAGLNYILTDLYDGIFIIANLSYTAYTNPIGVNIRTAQTYSEKTSVRIDRKDKWLGLLSAEWRVAKLMSKLKFQFNYFLLRRSGLINAQPNQMSSQGINWHFEIVSLGKDRKWNYDLGVKHKINLVVNTLYNSTASSHSWEPYLILSTKIGKYLRLYFDNRFPYYITDAGSKRLNELGVKAEYKKPKSPFRFWFTAHDILNLHNTTFAEQTADALQFSVDYYSRLPGYLGVGLSYKW